MWIDVGDLTQMVKGGPTGMFPVSRWANTFFSTTTHCWIAKIYYRYLILTEKITSEEGNTLIALTPRIHH